MKVKVKACLFEALSAFKLLISKANKFLFDRSISTSGGPPHIEEIKNLPKVNTVFIAVIYVFLCLSLFVSHRRLYRSRYIDGAPWANTLALTLEMSSTFKRWKHFNANWTFVNWLFSFPIKLKGTLLFRSLCYLSYVSCQKVSKL